MKRPPAPPPLSVPESIPTGPFRPEARCRECLLKLTGDVARKAAPNDPLLRETVAARALEIIDEAWKAGLTSPETANRILRMLRARTGIRDPFQSFKRVEMTHAREVYTGFASRFDRTLRALAGLAALGNSLDFFRDPREALDQGPRPSDGAIPFHHDDTDRLENALSAHPTLVLYLTDNAGEIFFDRPLYEEIRRRARRAVLVVKGGPGLNDLTREELETEGLLEDFGEVADTGADGAGVDWEAASDKFLDLLDRADLVVSKGMANFETLLARHVAAPVFYLFKVKCEPIGAHLNAPAESYWALWREGHGHPEKAEADSAGADQGERAP